MAERAFRFKPDRPHVHRRHRDPYRDRQQGCSWLMIMFALWALACLFSR